MQRIFIAGMPRSGSMWTYNVTRNLIKASGQTLVPELVPINEVNLIEKYSESDASEADFFCIKTHLLITPLDSKTKIICNYRDVRDAMISFMKFTSAEFNIGIIAAEAMIHTTDHYFQVGNQDNSLKIRYEQMIESNFNTTKTINNFLNLDINDEDIIKIIQDLSRDNIEKKFSEFDLPIHSNPMEGSTIRLKIDSEKYEFVQNFNNTYRLFEKETGFQSNHITRTKNKEWKKCLSISQQKALIDLTSDWLNRYGYDIF